MGPLSSFHHPSGIWSSPYESCRILVATPYQGSLPLVMSGSAQPSLHSDYSALCFDSGYSAFLLLAHCAGDPFKSWVLNSSLSIMRSLSLPDETSPLYAPDPCHPWPCHPRDPSMTLSSLNSRPWPESSRDPVNSCIWLLQHHDPAPICQAHPERTLSTSGDLHHASSNPRSQRGYCLHLVYI